VRGRLHEFRPQQARDDDRHQRRHAAGDGLERATEDEVVDRRGDQRHDDGRRFGEGRQGERGQRERLVRCAACAGCVR
jgi:hypothetical protein